MADESMDITVIEQLSFSCRYISINEDHPVVREDFLDFIPIYDIPGENIAKTILQQCEKLDLDMKKCVGQGYDGASSMTGHEKGVQARIRRDYSKARYIYCASHKLNLALSSTVNTKCEEHIEYHSGGSSIFCIRTAKRLKH
ncbi:hypothetical protein NQ314_010099 [Rhamnusium bicolor]|uniref:DUF4371 domain-containing protein n=1 Tax=Rhamnusium bicolor TaxID=1586634 RepID=A0AAV8XV44_9CUCU|nr:hypothetical protein NQ314_010099 [Rhamnusium bicolor]